MGVYRGALTDKKSFEVGKEGDVLTLVGTRGSTTFVTFELDGLEQTAVFPSRFSMPSDAARLMSTPTASQPLTVLAHASPGADLTFFCR